MREVDPKWSRAVFVCCHERPEGAEKASCGVERGSALRDALKARMGAAGHKGVVLTAKSGCLGVCSRWGVTVAAVPASGEGRRQLFVHEDGDDEQALFERLCGVVGLSPGPQ